MASVPTPIAADPVTVDIETVAHDDDISEVLGRPVREDSTGRSATPAGRRRSRPRTKR